MNEDWLISDSYRETISRPEYEKMTREEEAKATPEELVKRNLRFVINHVGRKYGSRPPLPREELVSCGNLGLIEASKRFDPKKGFKFITYAVWWIEREIQKAIGENTLIRIPDSVWSNNGKRITYGDDAISEAQLVRVIEAIRIMNPMNEDAISVPEARREALRGRPKDVGVRIKQNVPDEVKGVGDEIEEMDTRSKVWDLLLGAENVSERDKDVVMRLFAMGEYGEHTLEEVGIAHGISRERVRQIREKSLVALRFKAERMWG